MQTTFSPPCLRAKNLCWKSQAMYLKSEAMFSMKQRPNIGPQLGTRSEYCRSFFFVVISGKEAKNWKKMVCPWVPVPTWDEDYSPEMHSLILIYPNQIAKSISKWDFSMVFIEEKHYLCVCKCKHRNEL